VELLNPSLHELLMRPNVYYNLSPAQLVEHALKRNEAVLTDTGALCATTGKYTGRSPKDKYIVDQSSIHDKIDWGNINQPISAEKFHQIYDRMLHFIDKNDLYVFDGFAGADPAFRLPIRVINQYAWHNLFVHQLFIRPTASELNNHQPEFTVICLPGLKAIPELDGTFSETFIILNFEEKLVLIGGTEYAGEMKKSIFSVMNYLLPQQGVMPMHCSANVGKDGDVALFFGLSGTGKTTLSADPNRHLIGDDEHGWSDHGIFNIEGGCYAKCIQLSQDREPQIWNAIKFGSVLENVVLEPDTRKPDYNSSALTENTRAAYPIDYIEGAWIPGVSGHPKVIIFLTADAFGVLPPIARLSEEQAMYHFLSGYTSKLAGTERGITEPEATFSTCFGSPFLPLHPYVYAELLGKKIKEHHVRVYLVNTGWSGGPYGVGQRIKLSYTRAMINAILDGSIDQVETEEDPIFGLTIPLSCPHVPSEVLIPRNTWADQTAYDLKARELAERFVKNFEKFSQMPEHIKKAGPKA